MTVVLLFLLISLISPDSTGVMACPTILFTRYGPAYEANPVIRSIGPNTYFALGAGGVLLACQENRTWQRVSIVVWAVQTAAVNTHIPYGTAQTMPVLYF